MSRVGSIIATLALALWLAPSAWAATAGPDDFGYVAADQAEDAVTYEWVDTSGGTAIPDGDISDDTVWGPLALGFTFEFYGAEYTEVYVLSNGALVFEEPVNYEFFTGSQCPLPYDDAVNGMVAFYHRDFNPADAACGDGCSIDYATGGTEPDRWWALSYNAVPVWHETADPADPVTVQVVLYEGSNAIRVQVAEAGEYTGSDATIGIEAPDAIAGLAWGQCLTEGSIQDEMAVVFTPPTEGTPVVPKSRFGFDQPGETLDYLFYVFNLNAESVTFDLAVSGNDWDTALDTTNIVLAAGANDSFTVTVDIPAAAEGGDADEATVTLTPQGGGDALEVTTLSLVQDAPDSWQPVSRMPLLVDRPVAVGVDTDIWVISGTGYDAIGVSRFVTDYVQVLHLGGQYREWDFSIICPDNADWDADQECCANASNTCVDPAAGTLAPMPEPRVSAQGCALDGNIYVAGGIGVGEEENFVADTLYIYDTEADTWTMGAAMPEGRFEHAMVCDPGRGKVFVIGGTGPFPADPEASAESVDTIWAYDVSGNTWDETLTAMDVTRSSPSAELIDADTILVAGGFVDDFLSVQSHLYDIENDTWTRTGDLPWERLYMASALLPPGRMCLIGGTSFAGGQYNANDDSYDCFSNGYWIPQAAVTGQARTRVSGATLGDMMYLVGGVEIGATDSPFNPTQYDQVRTVERYPTGPLPPEPPVEPTPDLPPDTAPDVGPDVGPDVPTTSDVTPDTRPDQGDVGPSGGDDDGCGCASAGRDDLGNALLLLGLFLGLVLWGRRRR